MTPDEMVARIRVGEGRGAVEAFMRANPGVSYETMIMSALQWGIKEATDAIVDAAIAADMEDLTVLRYAAMQLNRKRRYAESAPLYEFLATRLPDDALIHNGRCWAQFAVGNLEGLRVALRDGQSRVAAGEHLSWQAGVGLYDAPMQHLHADVRDGFVRRVGEELARRLSRDGAADQEVPSPPRAGTVRFGRPGGNRGCLGDRAGGCGVHG